MGRIKHIHKIRQFFKESPVVSIYSLKKFLPKKSRNYLNLMISNMTKKGEIKKITKGFYTIYEEPSLAVFCFQPAYLGLQDALSIHNLWEQEAIPIVITTKKVRTGLKKFFGANAMIRRINNKYFFGFEHVKEGDYYLPVSDIEKTLIDMVYFRQSLEPELLRNILDKINKKKLNSYLKKYPRRFKAKVLRLLI